MRARACATTYSFAAFNSCDAVMPPIEASVKVSDGLISATASLTVNYY